MGTPRWLAILLSVFAVTVIFVFILGEAVADGDEFKDIPSGQQLFEKSTIEEALWPTVEEIAAKRVPNEEVPEDQLSGTVNWIRKYVRDKWVPDDIKQRLIPLRKLDGKNDCFVARYEVDGWQIQIKDSESLYLVLRPKEAPPTLDDIASYVRSTIQTIVDTDHNAIAQNLEGKGEIRQVAENIYRGALAPHKKEGGKLSPYEPIEWVSDGRTVQLRLTKMSKVDPTKGGIPFKYLQNKNLDSKAIDVLLEDKKKAVGHKKFALLPEDEEIKKKYDKLIEEELQKSGEQPPDSNADSEQGEEPGRKHEATISRPPEIEEPEQAGERRNALPQPELAEPATSWLVPGLVAAAVVLAGAVVLLLLRRKR